MEILFILIPLSLCLVAFALWSFLWSVKNDQFDDLDRQGWSILFDDTRSKQQASQRTADQDEQRNPASGATRDEP